MDSSHDHGAAGAGERPYISSTTTTAAVAEFIRNRALANNSMMTRRGGRRRGGAGGARRAGLSRSGTISSYDVVAVVVVVGWCVVVVRPPPRTGGGAIINKSTTAIDQRRPRRAGCALAAAWAYSNGLSRRGLVTIGQLPIVSRGHNYLHRLVLPSGGVRERDVVREGCEVGHRTPPWMRCGFVCGQ